jgi:cobaltochelatase CobT
MPKPNDGPVEAFRQVTAATMRAVSHDPQVQVTFAPEGATLRGAEARLPMPSRDLPPGEVAIVRGEADAMALRLRHHDAEIHARRQPSGAMSRAIFEAVEQARCEALGARQMSGVKANLAAALD